MLLAHEEVVEFYYIWYGLMWEINNKYKIVEKFEPPHLGTPVDANLIFEVRNKLWENPEWLDEFTKDTVSIFDDKQREIIKNWRNCFVKDRFVILKNLKKHTVFMSFSEPMKLYGIHGIMSEIVGMFPNSLPVFADAVLLPFNDKIIFDSLLSPIAIQLGSGIKASLN